MPSADADTTDTTDTTDEAEAVTDEAREALLEAVTTELGDAVVGHHLAPGRDLWIRVATPVWAETADYLRNRQRFRFFDWLSAVDWLPSPFGRSLEAEVDSLVAARSDQADGADDGDDGDEPDGAVSYEEAVTGSNGGGAARFQVMARVYSLATGIGINVKTDVAADMSVPTWSEVYPGADWHEREAFEMFGIEFDGHPSLRNLYLPGDFEGYPLRKDYPLLARLIKPWPGIVDVEPMPELPATDNPEDTAS